MNYCNAGYEVTIGHILGPKIAGWLGGYRWAGPLAHVSPFSEICNWYHDDQAYKILMYVCLHGVNTLLRIGEMQAAIQCIILAYETPLLQ